MQIRRSVVALAVTGLAAGGWWLYRSRPGAQPAPPLPAPEPRRPATLTLLEARLPDEVPADGALLFLPFVNRSPHRVHPTLLRGFDHTLAAFAHVFLGRPVIDPEVAWLVATRLGYPVEPCASDRRELARDAVAQALDGLGATAAVWGEIDADLGLTLHAVTTDQDVDPDPARAWEGTTVRLEGKPDRAFDDGPRQLLAHMLAQGQFGGYGLEPLQAKGDDAVADDHRQRLRRAWEDLTSTAPQRVVRAEWALARLAGEEPRWASPWAGLAFARAQRAWITEFRGTTMSLQEGPSPARHFARLLGATRIEDQVHLAFVEILASVPGSEAELARLALEEGAPTYALRMLAATEAPLPVEAAEVPPSGAEPLDRLWEVAYQTTIAGRDAHPLRLLGLSGAEQRRELLTVPLWIEDLQNHFERHGDWPAWQEWASRRAASVAFGALETLRQECAKGSSDPCRRALADLVARYAPAGAGGDVASAAADERFDAIAEAFLWPAPPSADEIPPEKVFRRNPAFAANWLLAHRLVEVANAVLGDAGQNRGGRADVASLLVRSPRRSMRMALEWVLDAASIPAYVGGAARSQRAEAEPYLKVLAPACERYDAPRYRRARIEITAAHWKPGVSDLDHLFRSDPYAWERVTYLFDNVEGDFTAYADYLATLVPRTPKLAQNLAYALHKANRVEEALAVLDQAHERRDWQADIVEQRDRIAGIAGRPMAERIAWLEAYAARFPRSHVQLDLAWRYLEADRNRDAERVFTALRAANPQSLPACEGLAEVLARDGQLPESRIRYAVCAEIAPDQWQQARLLDLVGRMHRDQGRWDEALAWHERSLTLVGGHNRTLLGIGETHALAGNATAAAVWFEKAVALYGNMDAYDQRALLQLRLGNVAAAQEGLTKPSTWYNDDSAYWNLYRAYRYAGDATGFATLAAQHKGPASLRWLAEMQLEDTRDLAAAAATVSELRRKHATSPDTHYVSGLVSLASGAPADAVEQFTEAIRLANEYPNAEIGRARALIAAGRLDEAETRTDAYLAARPRSVYALIARSHVLRARGEERAADDLLRTAGRLNPYNWYEQARILELLATSPQVRKKTTAAAEVASAAEPVLHRRPWEADLWSAVADLRERLGDGAGAAAARAEARRWNPLRYGPAT